MSCQCSECVALRDNGDDRSPDDFNPAFDMPRTAREALAVVAAWGDPGTMTFTSEKAKCCAELLHVDPIIEAILCELKKAIVKFPPVADRSFTCERCCDGRKR